MGWLRRLWARFRGEEPAVMAMALQVYKRPDGAAIVISCESGEVMLMLNKPRLLALCDLLLDTIEEAEPPPPVLQ